MFIEYELADGTIALVEVDEETAAFLQANDREMQNAERREHYHAPYHLEALDYEGDAYAYHETPERLYIRRENRERLLQAVDLLTPTQWRRLEMLMDGMSIRQIAVAEEADYASVYESIQAAKKKIKKRFLLTLIF